MQTITMGKKCFEPIFDDQDRIMPKLTYLEELRNAMDHNRTLSAKGKDGSTIS